MTEKEDFVVSKPYQPTAKEVQAIEELRNSKHGIYAGDWNSNKMYIKSFKNNLRLDMYRKQNKLCAFCRIHIPSACVPMHCEHIVYKNAHPQWTFLPENLCVACPLCNVNKGTTEVLSNPRTKVYPKTSAGFKIIHPMYDKYSDHIELIGGILYRGKTDKGVFTINTCCLHRVELAEERADQRMYEENKGCVISELVHLTKLSDQYINNQKRFIQFVKDIVKEYRQKTTG